MSHTDPDNSYEDDDMSYSYDYHDDFFDEDSSNYHPDAAHEISTHSDDDDGFSDEDYDDSYDDSMDGDAESAFGSCGWGVDEYYNSDTDYGEDY